MKYEFTKGKDYQIITKNEACFGGKAIEDCKMIILPNSSALVFPAKYEFEDIKDDECFDEAKTYLEIEGENYKYTIQASEIIAVGEKIIKE